MFGNYLHRAPSLYTGIYVFAAALPALLPTVFVVSVGISDNRLSKKRIACVNSEAILIAGKVQVALFDKTGTLTKQGLEFTSARSAEQWVGEGDEKPFVGSRLATGMSCCHTLAVTRDGSLIGNAVDKIMFEASGATITSIADSKKSIEVAQSVDCEEFEAENKKTVTVITELDGTAINVLKRFDFDHHRMTQSVIVTTHDGTVMAFVKGSTESIKHLCHQDSLPQNFETIVRRSASEGVYQISMAVKTIDPGDIELHRDDIEKDLTFVGAVSFKNVLREETSSVLRQLEEGDVRCVMVTGDNVLTGIHIAKESGMIKSGSVVLIGSSINEFGKIIWVNEDDQSKFFPETKSNVELAVTGDVWTTILQADRDYALSLIENIRVFGRCTPNDKISAVATLSDKGYITLMCGDGGNDCGALKTAHVGIALSDAEASIVSPFTSLDKCITSVPEVLKEGRCALASAFASYKYMIMYGQIEMINQMVNAYFQVTFAEMCW
jgi:magnesium-transporting ATPase (P-type)